MVETFRLHCAAFSVDARLVEINGRWLASVDTTRGPTLGCGTNAVDALWTALEPFDEVIGELMATLPRETADRLRDS